MLGKGLESLIPPHGKGDGDGGQVLPADSSPSTSSGQAPLEAARARSVSLPLTGQASSSQAPQDDSGKWDDRDVPADIPQSSFLGGGPALLFQHVPDDGVSEPLAIAPNVFTNKDSAVRPERGEKKPIAKQDESDSTSSPQAEYIFHIEVEKIKPNSSQPRRDFNEAGIRELAHSVREFGFLQPLVVSRVRRETSGGVEVEYNLIAGERRLLAAKMLGLPVVPAIIRNVNLEQERLELAVVENIQREDLNPIEVARALARLQDEFRLTQREIAAKLGKSRETVANAVRLLGLPIYIQEALEKGTISESHGRLLLTLEDPGAQKKLFDDLLTHRFTTRELKARVDFVKPRKRRAGGGEGSPELKMIEDRLSAELGTPVTIERAGDTGKITITFYSEEELASIVNKIGGNEQ